MEKSTSEYKKKQNHGQESSFALDLIHFTSIRHRHLKKNWMKNLCMSRTSQT